MLYQIKIKGELDQSWKSWLGVTGMGYEIAEDGTPITVLTIALPDQPALFGVLDHIRDLNLVLMSVTSSKEV